MDTPTNLANQVKVGHALDQSCSVQSRGPERAHQNNEPSWRSSRTDRRLSRQFWDINCLYLHIKCGLKTKTHFEWLLWHWSSLGQLNLEPTRPNGLVGCKVPTDLMKISVKKATHMGFYRYGLAKCCRTFFLCKFKFKFLHTTYPDSVRCVSHWRLPIGLNVLQFSVVYKPQNPVAINGIFTSPWQFCGIMHVLLPVH